MMLDFRLILVVSVSFLLMGIDSCPQTQTPPVEVESQRPAQCDPCLKEIPTCVSSLLEIKEPFCYALNKCENRLQCDACISSEDEVYLNWRNNFIGDRGCE